MLGLGKNELRVDSEIFVIFDSKTNSYSKELMQATNGADLVRRLINYFRTGKDLHANPHWMNAEDFMLFKVGSFDTKTGKLQPVNPEHVASFHELRAQVRSEQAGQVVPVDERSASGLPPFKELGIVPT